MKTIIITGASGFIGSNLTGVLSKKYKLILLLRYKKKIQKNNFILNNNISVRYFKDNKQLKTILKKIKASTLIHCATYYIKKHQPEDLIKIVNSNIEFGTILLDNLDTIGIKKFINFSTIWENYNGIKNNPNNLYAASKQAFEKIINYYQIKNKKIGFYNLMISDTYGKNDKRKKIINVLKKNINKGEETTIISKNLYINLLDIKDIISGVSHLLQKKIMPGKYILINKKNFKMIDIICKIKTKIKIKWSGSKVIKEKIYNYKPLSGWKPKYSSMDDLIKFISKD